MANADQSLRHLTGYQLRRTTSAAMPGGNKVLEQFGQRRSTYLSLAVIASNSDLNQVQLAAALAIERPNVVQIVDQLEQANLVQRVKSTQDRRAYALQPTPKGCEVHEQATEALEQFDAFLRQGLSQQKIKSLHHSRKVIEKSVKKLEARDVCEISAT